MNSILERINSAGYAFVEFALPMLAQSGLLILILLLADLLMRRKVRAVFRYWIWMLVLLKLLLPTSLSSPFSLGNWLGDELACVDITQTTAGAETAVPHTAPADVPPIANLEHIEASRHTSTVAPTPSITEPITAEPAKPPPVPVTQLSWQAVVFLVWLAVVAAMGLLLLQRAVFVRGLIGRAVQADGLMIDTLAHCCERMGMKIKVGLKVSANAASPAVCGLFRPVILVPQNLAPSLSSSQLRVVLLHELAHIKRGDLWVNLAQTILQIIYFYNPLLWLANAIIRRIREQAVDEMVLVAMGEKAQQYPQALVNVAKLAFNRPTLSLRLIGVVESKSALAGRIKHILNRPMPKKAKLGILGLLAVIVVAAILLPMKKAKDKGSFSDKDLLIKFTELQEGAAEKVSVDDITIWSNSYEVEFAPGEDMLVAAEVYQAGKPMRISGRSIFEGPQKPEKFTVTFVRTYQDTAKRSVTHNIQFKLGDQVFKIPEFPVHTPRYLSTEWWDWYRGEGLRRHETRHTKTKYAGIETLFYYGASDSSEGSEDKAEFWIPGRWVTPVMKHYCITLKMIPLSSLKYLYVEPVGGYQGLDGKIIPRNLTLEKADEIADAYRNMVGEYITHQESNDDFTATLPNGVTVELVGVCEHPSEGKQWWRPDGIPIKKAPIDGDRGLGLTRGDDRLAREFTIRVLGSDASPPPQRIEYEILPCYDHGLNVPLFKNGQPLSNIWVIGGSIPTSISTCIVKIFVLGWCAQFENVSLQPGIRTEVDILVPGTKGEPVPADLAFRQAKAKDLSYGIGEGRTQMGAVQAWEGLVKRSDISNEQRLFATWRMGCLLSGNFDSERGERPDFQRSEKLLKKAMYLVPRLLSEETINSATLYATHPGSDLKRAERLVESYRLLKTVGENQIRKSAERINKYGYTPDKKFFDGITRLPTPSFEERIKWLERRVDDACRVLKESITGFFKYNKDERAYSHLLSLLEGVADVEDLERWRNIVTTEHPNVQVGAPEIVLERSSEPPDAVGLFGRVVDAAGNPLAGAQVALSTEKMGVMVSHGKLKPMQGDVESRIVQTDSQGIFSLGQRPAESFDLIVAHEAGFALVESEGFIGSPEIRLQTWGRIEGQLAKDRKATDNKIALYSLPNSTWFVHKREYRYETKCDESGRFIFDKVPPGWFEVGYLTRMGENSWSITSRTPVEVKPGRTAKMKLGGEGRPVIGRFMPPQGYDMPIYFGNGLRALATKRPERPRPYNYERMTKRQQQQWYKEWCKTKEYKTYRDAYWHDKSWRQYAFNINKDGSFRIEDVIAGKYQLTVWIEERLLGGGRPEEIAGYYGTIEVPEIRGGRSDEPLDLGELELTIHKPLRVGDVAPLFEAKTLDGKDFKLLDYRGKSEMTV